MRADEQPRWSRAAGYTAALLSGLLMGVSWPLQKYVLAQDLVGPAALHWLNIAALCALISPVYLVRYGGRLRPRKIPLFWLVLNGIFACCIHYLRNLGLKATTATTAAVVERCEIVFVFALTYLVLHQRVRWLGWAGAALVVFGAVRVALIGGEELAFHLLGVLALTMVGLIVAVAAVVIKVHFSGIPNELVIVSSAAIQTLAFSVVVPAAGGLPEVIRLFGEPRILALVAVGSLVLGSRQFAYYYAMKRAPMWSVRMLWLAGPPVAVLADRLALGTAVTWTHLQGLLAAVLGAAMVILSGSKQMRTQQRAQSPAPLADE